MLTHRALSVCVLLCAAVTHTGARIVSLSNVVLPRDQNGNQLLTGEASAMKFGEYYFFYFNDWGSCPGVDCCKSSGGCASCCFNNPPYPIKSCQNPCEFLFSKYVHPCCMLKYPVNPFFLWRYSYGNFQNHQIRRFPSPSEKIVPYTVEKILKILIGCSLSQKKRSFF